MALVPNRSARILDIGCANGTLLSAMKARGYHALRGIDPSPESAVVARRLHGLSVETGTFARMPALQEKFDCISLTAVLEHLWNVDQAMSAILSLLDVNGVVHVEVPDASRYTDPYVGPYQDFSTEHINHFSGNTLAALGRRFGLKTVQVTPADGDLVRGVVCAGVGVTWTRDTSLTGAFEVARDTALVESLRRFTERSADDLAKIEEGLERQLSGMCGYIVWGFGELTMKLLALRALERRRLLGIVDSNPSRLGFCYGDIRVSSPEAYLPPGAPIIVGSLLSQDAIARHLADRRLPNPVILLDN